MSLGRLRLAEAFRYLDVLFLGRFPDRSGRDALVASVGPRLVSCFDSSGTTSMPSKLIHRVSEGS